MIKGFLPIVVCIVANLPFLFMALRSRKINLEKRYRGHQFVLPVIAVVYCLLCMICVAKIENILIKLVGFLANISHNIPLIGDMLSRLLMSWHSLFKIGYGIQMFSNLLIITVFCLIKKIVLPIVKKYWSQWHNLYELTAGYFYNELGEHSILKQKYAHMRIYFNAMYYTLVIIGFFDCVAAFVFSGSTVFRFPFYPVFGIIVFGEISSFLDGETFDEANLTDGHEAPGTVGVDYSKIMEELKRIFGDRLNLDTEIPRLSHTQMLHDWESELINGDAKDQITGSYFEAMVKTGIPIDPDYVSATKKMLHEKSVLIYNPFYHDLTPYLLLPMFDKLLNHHTCLVICGRMSDESDIKKWLHNGIENTTNLPKLWKINDLDEHSSDSEIPDIGILGFRKLYDLDTLRANEKFFKKTELIILLEPSNLLGTGQIGLRSILQYCEQEHKTITYCALDRNADGLVDALSHAIRQSITEVIASPVPTAPYCRMLWKAEGTGIQNRILPRISHYLGIGTEIASLAMHEGVENIHWYSGEKMPLIDLKWNVEQYYPSICQYIHSPREQSELDVRFQFHEGLWQADQMTDVFVIVEDEFCNVFEMSRTFAARIQKKGFINILSENYLLRDYMCDNDELFSNDPKAIPSIVPDYARTERNLTLRMIMQMAVTPVDEKTLSKELSLHGCETKFPYETLCKMIEKYTGIKDLRIQTVREDVWIGGNVHSKFSYKVDKNFVETLFDSALKSAHYVVENEKTDTYPMGNRLLGHIDQVLLPGQFFSYSGKYYQVRNISEENGIILRRAADHITGRKYYRQIRHYQMDIRDLKDNTNVLRSIIFQTCHADIEVKTEGYLEMKAINMLESASVVKFDKERERKIIYKDVLKVRFVNITAEQRFTICVLFNELFRTIYPNESGYIVALTPNLSKELLQNQMYPDRIRSITPSLDICNSEENCIYFVEDSTIDLGILVSIERNFQRFLEIITDYLDWYLDPSRNRIDDPEKEDEEAEDRTPSENKVQIAFSGAAASDVDGEDEELIDETDVASATEKMKEFLTYGFEKEPDWLDLKGLLEYLKELHFDDSNLNRSRKKTPEFDDGSVYDPNQPGVHYCDFCGVALETGKYDVLKDGRERCPQCSSEAVKNRKQFKKVYVETLEEMERIFDIKIDVPIKVRMANARKVNDIPGVKWTPTPQSDGRVLGYAQRSKDGYKLLVESGAPLWAMKSTLVHELTHIWQFVNWTNDKTQKEFHNADEEQMNMEGMAVWTEVQYLTSMGEKERAIRYKRNRDADPSVYGVGMKKFLNKYPIKEISVMKGKKTPFNKFPPLK